ncbi:MAG: TonB-dependent receptor [Bacteroidetes bacterium]|nr:TonB-dependent receptor [Bacteroidota bacterium]MBU1113946.1 TonB-dependent receptor [Bacteroidota bacterium]MBU1798259.1 TonB-dependent receptor [Bacteroidota bacterium]
MKRLIIVFLISLPVIFYAGTTGKIVGRIVDNKTDEPLIGANVMVVGTSYGAATDIDGNYIIVNIPPGTYTLRISMVSYKTIIMNDVNIVADRTTNISDKMQQSDVELDQIVISAETPLIQIGLTSSVSVMTRDEIEELPISSFTELLAMQAGVVGNGSNLHIRGGRSNEVAYLVDGMSAQDPLLGGLATEINNDAIQEMSLLSGTFNAEYGNALSGVVNIVTRDGSDQLSGKAEFSTSEFGVKKYADQHELRFNGNLSGPLFSPNLTYFISGEKYKRGSYLPFGYYNSGTFFSKLTYRGFTGAKISMGYRSSIGDRQSYNHSWKYIPEQYSKVKTTSNQASATLTHTLSQNLFYDIKLSLFEQSYYSGINKDTSQYLSTSEWEYLESAGTGFEFYKLADPLELTDSKTRTFNLKADIFWQINKTNEIKLGFQYKKYDLKLFSIYDPKRTFPYLNDYNEKPFEVSGYLQDKIELPYIVINLGLRIDYMNSNAQYRVNPLFSNEVITSKARMQLSPRIGIAHPISDRTQLHFSYGHFFQNPEYQFLYENKQYDYDVREPLFGQPNLDAQRTVAYEFGVTHQFTDKMAISLSAYYKDVTGLIGTRYYFPYVDGRFTGYTQYVNEDYANIKGFEINVDARSTKYFSGGLTYTFSMARGSASSETEQYPGTDESTLLYYLDFDKRHVINLSTTFKIPKDEGVEIFNSKIFENMDFTFVARAGSGYPYTPSGRDIGFVVKNSLRLPWNYTIDVSIVKELSITDYADLRIFAEVLNLTDYKNIIYVYPDTGDPESTNVGIHSDEYIKDPSNYGPPRLVRLGLGIKF